ncbi:MAG TPA: hypothetical protein VGQ49_07310 [Bryobacteraceae bacterium]|jgi:hypothetical protein|nr:hypothetical protein [Bryobacteraceae bacterium]
MTNCTSLSGSTGYESSVWFDAETAAGVKFRVARISVARRIELARRIREIGRNVEFLEAGQDPREKLEAAVLAAEIDRVYLQWGLEEMQGLSIDGEAATPAALIDKGPLELAKEILARIKRECGLSEDQRKN